MMVDTAGEREVIFMNVAGEIGPEEIGELAASLGVGEILDEVLDKVDSSGRGQRHDTDDPPVDPPENGEE